MTNIVRRWGSSKGTWRGSKSFHSRYEDKESFEYDGETFVVDEDKRGGTTKDGKRTMMFPDEILYAREQMVQDYLSKAKSGGGDGLSSEAYSHALWLAQQMKTDIAKYSDAEDKDRAQLILDRLVGMLNDPSEQAK